MKRTRFKCKGFLPAINGQPSEYRIKSGVATQTLDELFSRSNELLNGRLDNLMKIFKRRNANLYSEYQKARIVVDS